MTNFYGNRDDIHYEVLSKDIADVYIESQRDPEVNTFVKKLYYTMKEPSYMDWKMNSSGKVEDDEERSRILRSKLESILRSERLSQFLDENGINLNAYNTWVKKKFSKGVKKEMKTVDLPEWVRRYSKKRKDEDADEDEEQGALLKNNKYPDEEKKPKKAETKDK
ncbi:hypothetical protein ENUP19_0342G0010 [Entamoeba nuttalli]|uniref:Uncharacterized protein n=2 Tax=Entamoeba nuttalli TaxID=412467 RepID=K2G5D2_ENTNP|nr:hypothetical protein ENU1_193740 [Entamoeba nuttalli P19]EKE37536.1 hypothetical protein ENU1_193740 [Entamoeba nuttalli P19]|eukprot:XP_008860131.1 hypothetical protein ENU1_193740 [Entamoeba nuttalli P19]